MWLKCIWHPQNAIFTQIFAMSVTLEIHIYIYIYIYMSNGHKKIPKLLLFELFSGKLHYWFFLMSGSQVGSIHTPATGTHPVWCCSWCSSLYSGKCPLKKNLTFYTCTVDWKFLFPFVWGGGCWGERGAGWGERKQCQPYNILGNWV